ncbi:MAG: phospholipid carrier-dependent glycosyltransferase [bacterium]|nr:phospholipid carrier-dependent glycosyltransferase [bacterium]
MKKFIKDNKFLIIFILFFFFIRLFELNAVGETWDEIAKVRNGQLHLKAISHLDFSYKTWEIHKEHPPLGKILLALPTYLTTKLGITLLDDSVYQVSKQYNFARLLSLIFASGTLFLTYFISKKWFSKTTAWIAVVGLSLFPHFVAHSFIATLESPQTFFVTLLFFLLVYFDKHLKTSNLVLIAVVVATTLLVKLSSIFFLPLPFLFSIKSFKRSDIPLLLKANLIIYIVAVVIFILLWPWLWANPLARLFETLAHFNVSRTEYFMGQLISPPFYYYLYYFAISVPILYFVGFVIGIKNIFSRKYLLILIWFLLPFLASFSGFKQNGVRYLHSSFPAFSILVAVGFNQLFLNIKRKYFLMAGILISVVITNVSVSPYYLDYYNIFVSVRNNVYNNRLAQIGWWGEGTKQAIIYLNKISEKNDTLCIKITPAHVIPLVSSNFIVYYDDSDIITCNSKYLVINTLDKWRKGYEIDNEIYKLIYQQQTSGSPIVQVFKHK